MSNSTFQNLVVILTGASSGIGRELAYLFASQGARLVLAARRVAELEETAAECNRLGGQALAVPTDVSREADCRNLIDRAVTTFGKIDVLVNNAGITMWSRVDEIQDLSIYEKVMQVNFLGSVYCTSFALPYIKQTHGRIVGVCSLAGRAGIPARSGYAASKHAMAGFFDSLRAELLGSGVSVTMTFPDFVATGYQAGAFRGDGSALGKNPVKVKGAMTPQRAAEMILQAAARRKREEILSFRGRVGQWIKLMAPGVIDRMALQAINTGR